MIVTFCGHRLVEEEPLVRRWLEATVTELIQKEADEFYLGGYGGFDRMALSVVNHAKEEHPCLRSVLVLPYLDRKTAAEEYDHTIYPPLENVPKRFAILKRNRWMVDKADVIVAYVIHEWGGAAATLRYAESRGKPVVRFSANPHK